MSLKSPKSPPPMSLAMRLVPALSLTLGALLCPPAGAAPQAQPDAPSLGFPGLPAGRAPRVEIPWNRLYDYPEIHAHFDRLMEQWPNLLEREVIGHSVENREMRVYILSLPSTGAAEDKPAMWIDGNIHGNEVQGAEATLYAAWYLLENYGSNPRVTQLVERSTFYFLPMVNPDGRAHWFNEAHSASSSRTGYRPDDDDRDGTADEDGPDDMDGDGNIVQMRKHMPGEGTHRLNPDDPRILERVPSNDRGLRGDWILLGSEGIDDDGDGRANEDGPGGYDMNRAWPSSWQPEHVQRGAGPYPLYWPETRVIARFILEHPNIAAVQSFHNAGGMILRGPGSESYGSYPSSDARVYDELGKDGERMLPFYRYMVIWKDLYTVFGGFVNWTYEGLGIFSFTNELWTRSRLFPDASASELGVGDFQESAQYVNDKLYFGSAFVDWHEAEHPLYGSIEIGGFVKDYGRVPPSFLIEEMLHRNMAFCLEHAEAMPWVVVQEATLTRLGGGVRALDVVFRNESLIPTRSALAARDGMGVPDRFEIVPGSGVRVLAGGVRTDRFRADRIELEETTPESIVHEAGVPGRGEVRVRWLLLGDGSAEVAWRGEKGQDRVRTVELD